MDVCTCKNRLTVESDYENVALWLNIYASTYWLHGFNPTQLSLTIRTLFITLSEPLQVAVNNQHFIVYRSRTPNLQAIQWIEVGEDVTISSIFVH